jgi:hypothetical protein
MMDGCRTRCRTLYLTVRTSGMQETATTYDIDDLVEFAESSVLFVRVERGEVIV